MTRTTSNTGNEIQYSSYMEQQRIEKEKIEQALRWVNIATRRVLIANVYEGYELRKLKEALELLTAEANKK